MAPPMMAPAPFQPGIASPSSTVELSLSCKNLLNADLMSLSDPFCVVSMRQSPDVDWVEIFRTETIQDTLNPVWGKKLVLEYRFEERQNLLFKVFDRDSPSEDLQLHDYLGCLECSLGEIVAKQSQGFSKNLEGVSRGTIQIVAEEMVESKEEVTMQFAGRKLDKMNWLWFKSDPYMEISRSTESNQYILVHRTEAILTTLNPDWRPLRLKVGTLCNGDYDRDLKFDLYDWNQNGNHKHMGTFHSTLRRLQKGPGVENMYQVIREHKGSKRNAGTVHLQNIKIEVVPSFLDYIRGGTEVNFTVAVDFTASNGNPNDQRSLHYRDPTGRPNQYVTAIQAVGEIIQDYDSDNQYPALGFGARIPPHGAVSHEFFLNLDPNNPFCAGIDGILAAYFHSLYNVQLYGPTNFAPVIRHVARFAQVYQHDATNYFVLLIITDGVITDFEETKKAIISASDLPMSIIIVGVGSEDFHAMDELDSDECLLRSGNQVAKRDIVQFVELQKFVQPGRGWSKELLAREVLAEIPDQLLSYMKSKGFQPPAAQQPPATYQSPASHQPPAT